MIVIEAVNPANPVRGFDAARSLDQVNERMPPASDQPRRQSLSVDPGRRISQTDSRPPSATSSLKDI